MTKKTTEYMIARPATILAALQRTIERITELPLLREQMLKRQPSETRLYTEVTFDEQLRQEEAIRKKLLDMLGGKQ